MSITAKPTKRALAVAAVAFATALGGCGSSTTGTASNSTQAQAADVGSTTPGTQGAATQGTTPGGGLGVAGGPGGMDTAALAKTLGVSETKLTAALAKARPSTGTQGEQPQQGQMPDRTEMYATVAEELDLTEAKVQAAFEAQLPTGGPGGGGGGTPPAGAPSGTDGSTGDSSGSSSSSSSADAAQS